MCEPDSRRHDLIPCVWIRRGLGVGIRVTVTGRGRSRGRGRVWEPELRRHGLNNCLGEGTVVLGEAGVRYRLRDRVKRPCTYR